MPFVPRLLIASLALLVVGCSSRIPVEADLTGAGLGDETRGRAIVDRALEAHGGRAAWLALDDVTFELVDDWHGLATASAPWPVSDPAEVHYCYNFSKNKGRAEFREDPTVVWGHDSVEPWVEMSGERIYEDLDDVQFMIPTVAYFVALPFKFADPGARLMDAGPREHEGRMLDTVLVTFGAGVGVVQDRYLAYFDPDTGRFLYTTFTVYEQSELMEGYASYTSWQRVEGLLLPERIDLGAVRPIEMEAHTMVLSEVNLHPHVDPADYEKPDAR